MFITDRLMILHQERYRSRNKVLRLHKQEAQMFMSLTFLLLLTQWGARGFCPSSPVTRRRCFRTCVSYDGLPAVKRISGESAPTSPGTARTLYDVIGAQPDDPLGLLRKRFAGAAKLAHPDAGATANAELLSEIYAAWSILSDPKEKQKYDRSLRAKQFGNLMGSLFEASIDTAIPILKKTAGVTVAAVKTSSEVMQDVGEQVKKASDIFDVDKRIRELEQRAEKKSESAALIKKKANALSERRSDALSDQTDLSSADALRILEGFYNDDSRAAPQEVVVSDEASELEIEKLIKVETEYKESLAGSRDREKDSKTARDERKSAESALALAAKALEESQRALEEAQKVVRKCKETETKKKFKEAKAASSLKKAKAFLDARTKGVRAALRRREERSLKLQGAYLRAESERLLGEAGGLREDGKGLKSRAAQLKKEQEALVREQEEERRRRGKK